MSRLRTAEGSRIPVAFQTISLTDSTAIGINSTVRDAGAHLLVFSVETQSVRMRADSTAPTLATGVLYAAGQYEFPGYNGTSSMQFQRSTGSATVQIMAYKYDG